MAVYVYIRFVGLIVLRRGVVDLVGFDCCRVTIVFRCKLLGWCLWVSGCVTFIACGLVGFDCCIDWC